MIKLKSHPSLWSLALLFLSLVWMTAGPLHADLVSVTESFDAAEDFNAYGKAEGSNVTASWNATSGRDDGGGIFVDKPSKETGAFNGWLPDSFSIAGQENLQTSVLIHTGAWNSKDNWFEFGFVANGGDPVGGESNFTYSGNSYRSIIVQLAYSTSDSGRFEMQLYNKSGTGSASTQGSKQTIKNLNSGANAGTRDQWLRLNLTLVPHPTIANAFNAVATLEKLGTSGSDEPVQLLTTSATITNVDIYNATAAYSAFNLGIYKDNTGATRFDDHRVTIEANAPDAPTVTEPDILSTTRLRLNWEGPTEGRAVSSYLLEVVKAGEAFEAGNFIAADGTLGQEEGISLAGGVTAQLLTNLDRNQEYEYRLLALNAAGSGLVSSGSVTTSDENVSPTLDPISAPPALDPTDRMPRSISLTGISHGGDDGQTLTVTATSSDPAVVPHPAIEYESPSATGTLTYAVAGQPGTATITVTVTDSGDGDNAVSQTFTVQVKTPPLSVGFDTEGEYEEHFASGSSSNLSGGWDASAGTGTPASGGILVERTTSGSAANFNSWRKQPLNLVGKSNIDTSIMFRADTWNNSGDVYLGFAINTSRSDSSPVPDDATNFLVSGNNYRAIAVYLDYSATNDRFQLALRNKASTGSASSITPVASISPVSVNHRPNWLRLSLSLVPTGDPHTYEVTTTLENLGPDGTDTPNVLTSTTATLANEAIFNAESAYAAYNLVLDKSNAGNTKFDNHEASAVTIAPGAPIADPATVITRDAFTAHWRRPASSAVEGYILELIAKPEDYNPADPDASFIPTKLIDEDGTVYEDGSFEGIFLDPDLTTLRIEDLDYETTYLYRVIAYNGAGESVPSAIIELTTHEESYNIPPTLDPLSDISHALNPGRTYTFPLSGITTGGETDQDLEVIATTSDGEIVTATVEYTPNEATGTLKLAAGYVEGEATITVTVYDGPEGQSDRAVSRTITVSVKEPPSAVSFDDQSDFDSYVTTPSSSGITATWGDSFGAGETPSGGVKIQSTTSSDRAFANWLPQPYSLAGATSIRSSILVKLEDASKKVYFGVGLTTAEPESVTGSSLEDFLVDGWSGSHYGMAASLRMEDKSKFEKLYVWNKSSTSSKASELVESSSKNDSSLAGQWLRLSFIITPSSSNPTGGTVQYLLESLGADGTSAPVTVSTTSKEFTNEALLSSQAVYAVYNVSIEKAAGSVYVDDHEVEVIYASPDAPTGEEATKITSTGFLAQWTPPADTYYTAAHVEVSTTPDFEPNTFVGIDGSTGQAEGILVPGRTARELRFVDLDPETTYYYRVSVIAPAGESEFSNIVTVETLQLGENAEPTLDPITMSLARVSPGSGSYQVSLSGITDGGEGLGNPADQQDLVVTVALDDANLDVVTAASIAYDSPNETGTLTFTAGGTEGTATLLVTVTDVPLAGSGMTAKSITRPLEITVAKPLPLIDFEASGDFATEFRFSGATGLGLSWEATAGKGALGGVKLSNEGETKERYISAWRDQPYSLAAAAEISTSILIKPSGWREKKSREQFRLGFTLNTAGGAPAENDVLRASKNYRGISAYLSNDIKEKNILTLGLSNKNGDDTGATTPTGTKDNPGLSIANGKMLQTHWLKLSLKLVPDGEGGFHSVARLDDLGVDGLSEPILLAETTETVLTNTTLAESTEAYAAFSYYQKEKNGGTIYLDDHFASVVYPMEGAHLRLESPANTELESGVSTVDYGTLSVGAAIGREFVIRNVGTEALSDIQVEVTGPHADFVTVGGPTETSLDSIEKTAMQVTFSNGAGGPLSATLRVTSAETADRPFEVALTAFGEEPPAPPASGAPGLSLTANPNAALSPKLNVPGANYSRSGGALAIAGNLAVVGADSRNAGGAQRAGTVSIHNLANGKLVRNITPPAGAGPEFGYSVAIFGSDVAIGSPGEEGSGAVYVYDANTGVQKYRAEPPFGFDGSRFGEAVAIDANFLVIGDPSESESGAAYLYRAKDGYYADDILPNARRDGQDFGATIAINGAQILVGAPGDAGGGAVYLFQTFDSTQTLRISNDNGAIGDRFGESLALDAQRIIVGAPGRYTDQGAAYVYRRSDGDLITELVASDGESGDAFGSSVALSAQGVVVGAAAKAKGATYLFNPTSGVELYRVTASDSAVGDGFGAAVAAAGNRVLVGAPAQAGGGVQRGGVYSLTFPPYYIDASVGPNAKKQVGLGIINKNGAKQVLNRVSKKLAKVKGIAKIANGGLTTDQIQVKGKAGNKFFKVKYFTATGERKNVTGAMTKKGHLATLAPGTDFAFSIEVVPVKKQLRKKNAAGANVILKKTFNGKITHTSLSDKTKVDAIKYQVKTK